MNNPNRWQAVIYASALFVAGAVCGAIVLHNPAPPAKPEQLLLGRVDEIAAKFRDKLKLKLDLTPEQLTKAEPLIRMASQKLEDAHTDCLKQIEQAVEQLHKDLCPVLNDEQKSKMKDLDAQLAASLWDKYHFRAVTNNSGTN